MSSRDRLVGTRVEQSVADALAADAERRDLTIAQVLRALIRRHLATASTSSARQSVAGAEVRHRDEGTSGGARAA